MPGILDYLSALGSALAGNIPPQQPQVPPNQAQAAQGGPTFAPDASGNLQANFAPPPPQPPTGQQPQQGGVTSFLSSPLTQGALGAYFGAIGAPRRSGLGGMLSQGGLTGLNEYNQARMSQLRMPLMAAQIANLQQRGQLAGAQTGLAQARTQQIAGIPEANAALAAQIHAAEQNMTPEQAQRAHLLETAIANDTSKVYDPKEVFAQIYEEPLKEKQTAAQTKAETEQTALAKAREGEIPGEEALHKAEAARADAEAAKAKGGDTTGKPDWYDPVAKQYYPGAKRNPNDVPASKGPSLTPKQPDELLEVNRLRTMYQAEHGIASKTGLGMSFEQYAVSKGRDPFTAKPLPPAPAGGGYVWDASSGQVLATDANGKPTHAWQPEY